MDDSRHRETLNGLRMAIVTMKDIMDDPASTPHQASFARATLRDIKALHTHITQHSLNPATGKIVVNGHINHAEEKTNV